jgi:crotonobetainyl-CoA:carnitine CoA-transferase CaiB-like acyl-CoA transferase
VKALKDELSNDPLARGYAGMSAQQRANALNAIDRNIGRAQAEDLLAYLIGAGLWVAIMEKAQDAGASPARAASRALVELQRTGSLAGKVDLSKAAFGAALNALDTAGLISAAQKAEIAQLGKSVVSRAQELGISYPVSAQMCADAMNGGY